MQRREVLQTLAALAAGRRSQEDYSLEELEEEYEPGWGATMDVGELPVEDMRYKIEGEVLGAHAHPEDLDERDVEVFYNAGDVTVGLAGGGKGIDAFATADFDPDAARTLAAAIYQAAEDVDARRGER